MPSTATTRQAYSDLYKRHRLEILGLAKEQLEIVDALRLDEVKKEGEKSGDVLRGAVKRMETDSFKVLVMGRFSAGKSTFINALLGEVVLPASPTPTTGVLCEVRHAREAEKHAMIYPKKGMGGRGRNDEPFRVEIGDLKAVLNKYVRIDHSGDPNGTSRYEKFELFWPLALCEKEIILIDSVGLDDPEAREKVTLDYAKEADAILFLMKSQDAYSAKDKQVIKTLNGLGFDSIFFLITYYDHVRESARLGEMPEAEFRQAISRNLLDCTRLGEGGIQYLDSRSALKGRISNDQAAIRESGIVPLETSLETFLFNERGRAKLLNSLRSVKVANREARKVIPPRVAMLQTDRTELEERYKKARIPLETLEQTKVLVTEKIQYGINSLGYQTRDLADRYFLTLRNKIPQWAEAYTIQTSIGFPPKIQPLIEEVIQHLTEEVESDLSGWSRTLLQPIAEKWIEEIERSVKDNAREFAEKAKQIRIELSVGSELSGTELAKAEEPSLLGRAAGLGYALLTGDFLTGTAGMLLGVKGMMTTIAFQITAGIILAIVGLLNPVAIVIAAVAAISAGAGVNLMMIKNKIKKTVGEKLLAELDSKRLQLCDEVRMKVVTALEPMKTGWEQRLAGELASLRGEAENAIEIKKKGQGAIDKEVVLLRRLEERNDVVDLKIDDLLEESDLLTK